MPLHCSLLSLRGRYSYYYILLVLQLPVCYFILVCYYTRYSRLLGPDASAYANGLVKTVGFTFALCIATGRRRIVQKAQCVVRERPPRKSEESPGQKRLHTGGRAQMYKFSRLTKIAWHSGVARLRKYQWSRRLSHGTASMLHRMLRTYTRGRNSRADNATTRDDRARSEKVSSRRRAISCAPRNTIYILCVTLSSYPAPRRGAKRFAFAAEVCKVHAVRHPRYVGSSPLEMSWQTSREETTPGVNRAERRATRQLRLVSRETNKKTKKAGILRVTRISAAARRARAEYFTSRAAFCCPGYGER